LGVRGCTGRALHGRFLRSPSIDEGFQGGTPSSCGAGP